MTQPPENPGGQPAGDRPPGSEDTEPPAQAPPPSSWYFPPEPVPPLAQPPQPAPPAQAGAYGTPAQPYPAQPQGETAQPYAGPPPYGAPQQPPPYGGPQQPYGMPQQPPPYGAPQQPYGMSPYGPAYPARGGAGYQAGPEPDLAQRWRRLLARIIDGLVLSIVLVPLSIPMLSRPLSHLQQVSNAYPSLSAPGARAAVARADGRLLAAFAVFAIIAAVVLFLYDWPQHAKWGQTLGKRALHTRVVTAYGRTPITTSTAAARSALYALAPAVPVIGGLFALINELWVLWDPRRQCLHDKAARTIVIRTDLPAAMTAQQPSPW